MKQICNKCLEEKSLDMFRLDKKNNKHRKICKKCESIRSVEYKKRTKKESSEEQKEKDRIRKRNKYSETNGEYKKQYYAENKDKIFEYQKYYNSKNKEKRSEQRKNYYQENKDKVKLIKKKWTDEQMSNKDSLHYLKYKTRNIISQSFKRKGINKKSKTEDILGCSYQEFKIYLESKFESWMNWNNKGLYNGTSNYGWDIDHIIPLSNANTEEEIIKLCHYTNLQPLCSYYNRHIKSNN